VDDDKEVMTATTGPDGGVWAMPEFRPSYQNPVISITTTTKKLKVFLSAF
jgi:hypothetical protein